MPAPEPVGWDLNHDLDWAVLIWDMTQRTRILVYTYGITADMSGRKTVYLGSYWWLCTFTQGPKLVVYLGDETHMLLTFDNFLVRCNWKLSATSHVGKQAYGWYTHTLHTLQRRAISRYDIAYLGKSTRHIVFYDTIMDLITDSCPGLS